MTRRVVIDYDSGFPTALLQHARLASMIDAHGEPDRVEQSAYSAKLEFPPIFPGVPVPVYVLANPRPGDKRRIVRVRTEGGAE